MSDLKKYQALYNKLDREFAKYEKMRLDFVDQKRKLTKLSAEMGQLIKKIDLDGIRPAVTQNLKTALEKFRKDINPRPLKAKGR